MKKSLLGVLALTLLSLYGHAQLAAPIERGNIPDVPSVYPKFNKTNHTRVNIVSDWYNYGQMIYNVGGDVSYFRNFLFPDSTVKVEFSDGMGYVWKHSMGEVFDPSSYLFDLNGQFTVETHIPYTLDSIAIPYRYWRFQNLAPDTVVVQVYMEPNITLVPTPGWSNGASYATVNYDYIHRIGDNETLTFKRLLTADDVSTTSQSFLEFQTNLNIPAGKKVAVTATYIPGNPFNVNDTIDTYTSFPISNPINAFIFYNFRDNDLGYEPLYYNNELAATTDVRYNISTTGWNGDYIPGTAWSAGIYYGDVYFKITFDTDFVGVEETVNEAGIKTWPNPTTGMIHLNSTSTVVKAEIRDLSGKMVMTVNDNNITSINAGQLSDGVYVLTLTNDKDQTTRQRFVKQ